MIYSYFVVVLQLFTLTDFGAFLSPVPAQAVTGLWRLYDHHYQCDRRLSAYSYVKARIVTFGFTLMESSFLIQSIVTNS
jgi:hypothetical protein